MASCVARPQSDRPFPGVAAISPDYPVQRLREQWENLQTPVPGRDM